MDGMDELPSPSLPTSPAAPIIVFPLPSMLSVLQLLGTIRCPEKPRAAHRYEEKSEKPLKEDDHHPDALMLMLRAWPLGKLISRLLDEDPKKKRTSTVTGG